MNNGELVSGKYLFENLVHPTLVKLEGSKRYTELAGRWLSDIFDGSETTPNNLIEAYMSRIAMTTTKGILDNVTPKRINHSRLPAVEPTN